MQTKLLYFFTFVEFIYYLSGQLNA